MISKSKIKAEIDNRQDSITVVVADDCQDNLMLIGLILDNLKLKYYFANDGEKALYLVPKQKPSLVLLDVVMPKMNGIEVNVLIKNNTSTNHIPTIAITGLNQLEHITSIENAGFDDYIIKPFIIEDLETKLKGLLKIG